MKDSVNCHGEGQTNNTLIHRRGNLQWENLIADWLIVIISQWPDSKAVNVPGLSQRKKTIYSRCQMNDHILHVIDCVATHNYYTANEQWACPLHRARASMSKWSVMHLAVCLGKVDASPHSESRWCKLQPERMLIQTMMSKHSLPGVIWGGEGLRTASKHALIRFVVSVVFFVFGFILLFSVLMRWSSWDIHIPASALNAVNLFN